MLQCQICHKESLCVDKLDWWRWLTSSCIRPRYVQPAPRVEQALCKATWDLLYYDLVKRPLPRLTKRPTHSSRYLVTVFNLPSILVRKFHYLQLLSDQIFQLDPKIIQTINTVIRTCHQQMKKLVLYSTLFNSETLSCRLWQVILPTIACNSTSENMST